MMMIEYVTEQSATKKKHNLKKEITGEGYY